jgi:hypothetical protein
MKKLVLLTGLLSLSAILIQSSIKTHSPAKPVYYRLANPECTVNIAVVDEEFIPFPGATIKLKGINKDTITNPDGMAKINIPQYSYGTIAVSFIGYQRKEIKLMCGNSKPYIIQLRPDSLIKPF